MHPSIRLCASAAPRQPLIHFTGKRQWKSQPPRPHPLAVPDLKSAFTDSLRKAQASVSESSTVGDRGSSSASTPPSQTKGENAHVYKNFWEAPEQYWKHDLEEWEVDLIATGGASQFA
ncbi:uncharacterized protein B0H18DRAFT_1117767 [Fomitopsis serialis]|uniref:uncharacterized protein n=1 Tax=Fomitopsis serialis TaxID=139415 RepID=UPI002007C912|nr:uncharacterized protein B0H18DRAFT_1117767 [Neoantrodia serialis]KAH9928958.1 hypothetical protein B0H18DRAFT_1117767 [Neoantrodia serialis]